ncbi:MAG TPA: ChbG/HpnK family deacetylase, partial [Victivallales bacterium]|nr:ChbG/HpnK family deacetylase [Victivallales bacterium]
NCSILACTDLLDHAYETLGNLKGLCFGLHATIACEWLNVKWKPIIQVDKALGFTDNEGYFLPFPNAVHKAVVPLEVIMKEISAQLDRLTRIGFRLSYIDLHMCFGWIEGVGNAVNELCLKKGLINGFSGYKYFPKTDDKKNLVESFLQAIKTVEPDTYLLIGHPAYDDEEMSKYVIYGNLTPVSRERDEQRRLFLDKKVMNLARSGFIKPIRYDELL